MGKGTGTNSDRTSLTPNNSDQANSQVNKKSARPLLLVDIDGVLNCFGHVKVTCQATDDFDIQVPQGTRTRLTNLEHYFEMIWATAWEHDAKQFLKNIDMESSWPVIEFKNASASSETWKLKDVQSFIQDTQAFAWIDDELGHDAHSWAQTRSAPTLLVNINPCYGLQENQTQQLINWALNL
jgi:hypothetical protein